MEIPPDRDPEVVCSKGWYPDPGDARLERWWDGERWTPQTRRVLAARTTMSTGSKVALWVLGTIAVVAVVLAIAFVVLFYVAFSNWGDNK
jgi:hypothetical protein